jgi:hypothetical protein
VPSHPITNVPIETVTAISSTAASRGEIPFIAINVLFYLGFIYSFSTSHSYVDYQKVCAGV